MKLFFEKLFLNKAKNEAPIEIIQTKINFNFIIILIL